MVTGFTELLRATPLEQIRLESIGWRSRRPVSRVVRSITAAAAVVAFATWFGVSYSSSSRVSDHGSPIIFRTGAALDNRGDWPAGLPQSRRLIQLVPGGLQTSVLTP